MARRILDKSTKTFSIYDGISVIYFYVLIIKNNNGLMMLL